MHRLQPGSAAGRGRTSGLLKRAYHRQNGPFVSAMALLNNRFGQGRTATSWREFGALAVPNALVRCDAAKGFACSGQKGVATGRGK
jgi:hypothetical protein